jgi:hypothetical protein
MAPTEGTIVHCRPFSVRDVALARMSDDYHALVDVEAAPDEAGFLT